VDPIRVPLLDGIDGDAVEQHGEVQVAVERLQPAPVINDHLVAVNPD